MDKNEYYCNPEIDEEENSSVKIDWIAYSLKLIKHWRFIVGVTMIAALFGVFVALIMKRTYTVSVMLAPELQAKSSAGNLGGMSSLLGLGNTGLGMSSDALNITLFPEISQSVLFLTQLFDVEVTPYVSPEELIGGATPAIPTTVYKYITKEDEEPGLISQLMESLFGATDDLEPDTLNIAQLSPKQRDVVKTLQKAVSADVDNKTGVATIRVTMDDPWIATTLADTVCQRLQNYVIAYRTKKSAEDLAYYEKMAAEAKEKMIQAQAAYALSVDYDRSVILQSVNSEKERLRRESQLTTELYSQMAQQVEMARAKVQEEKPVFAIVEAATMPEYPSSISRKLVVLFFIFWGFSISVGWKLFGEDYFCGFKLKLREKMDEESLETSNNNFS